jgi:hypothetical protein
MGKNMALLLLMLDKNCSKTGKEKGKQHKQLIYFSIFFSRVSAWWLVSSYRCQKIPTMQ